MSRRTGRRASTASRSCRSCRWRTCAAACPATTATSRRAGSRRTVAGVRESAASTCRTATRRRARNTTTSSPGWSGCSAGRRRCSPAEETAVIARRLQRHPRAEDCREPGGWANDALFLPETRAAFRRLDNLGFTDALRAVDQRPGLYTFWDYQAGALAEERRHPHRPRAADAAGGRPARDLRIDAEIRGAREAVRPRADLGRARGTEADLRSGASQPPGTAGGARSARCSRSQIICSAT